jgi:hypothetical protein
LSVDEVCTSPIGRVRLSPNPKGLLGRPDQRGWIKTKNPNYWRLDLEREAMQRSRERRERTHV